MPPRTLSFLTAAFVGGALFLATGCRRNEITTYQVEKDPPAKSGPAQAANTNDLPTPPAAASSSPAGTRPSAGAQALLWDAPNHWREKPASDLRRGSFEITGENSATADLSIIAFPGEAGGALQNVNRWRGQVKLPPLSADELPSHLQALESAGSLRFSVVDMTAEGSDPARLRTLAGFVSHGGETWFFKLTGPEPLLAREKPAFLDFLRSVRPR